MNKYLSVVFLLLFCSVAHALNLTHELDHLERKWAAVYYSQAESRPFAAYEKLMSQSAFLVQQFPKNAEPLLWQAIIIASSAGHQSPIQALEQIAHARDLLQQVINIEPNGLNGAAHVTLGTLYYMTPAWPLSFGDTDKAKELLTAGLKINPNSIEANYFYGDFLLTQNQPDAAIYYFNKAIVAPIRTHQQLADKSIQHQAKLALNNLQKDNVHDSKTVFLSLFSNTKP